MYISFGKRCFDIVFASLAAILLLPILLTIAMMIKIFEGSPVLYQQDRVGKDFKKFRLFKFRTMRVGTDRNGALVTRKGDSRITTIGNFLRKFKLDELPQIFNVLKGELSIVGPRPEVEKYVSHFYTDYQFILTVKPGITDYATLEFHHEEETLVKYDDVHEGYIKDVLPRKIRLYKQYIQDQSLLTDIKIILKTFQKILQ